jgi:hypothetical protein
MPPWPKPVSQNQRKAMYAAAEGKSTLGIPAKVGREFARGDKERGKAKLPRSVAGKTARRSPFAKA